MSFSPQFYTVSFEQPLEEKNTVTEYFYLQTDVALAPRLQTTQNPERYGGTVFLRSKELAEVLRLVREDARFSRHKVSVRTITLSQSKEMTQGEIDSIVKAVLFTTLDQYELAVLGVRKQKAVP